MVRDEHRGQLKDKRTWILPATNRREEFRDAHDYIFLDIKTGRVFGATHTMRGLIHYGKFRAY